MSNMPIARTTDPVSSHAAASEVTRSGSRLRQQRIALLVVRDYPGNTSREPAGYCMLDRYQLAQRLPELEESHLVRKGPTRECSVGKRIAVTWLPETL
jgi:hypothetical protein